MDWVVEERRDALELVALVSKPGGDRRDVLVEPAAGQSTRCAFNPIARANSRS